MAATLYRPSQATLSPVSGTRVDRQPSNATYADLAQLAQHYGVGTNVMQKAQKRLIVEGLLEGRAGSGTYVSQPRERRRMIRSRHRERRGGSPFQADMHESGRSGTWEASSEARTPAPENIARRLSIEPGDPTVRTTYKFLADGKPAQLSVSWEPLAITGGTPTLLPEIGPLRGKGVVERMLSIGVDIATWSEIPRPARTTQEQAALLGIALGDLVLAIERTYHDGDGRAVETADIVIPDRTWEVVYEFALDPPDFQTSRRTAGPIRRPRPAALRSGQSQRYTKSGGQRRQISPDLLRVPRVVHHAVQELLATRWATATADRTTRVAGEPGVRLRCYLDVRQELLS